MLSSGKSTKCHWPGSKDKAKGTVLKICNGLASILEITQVPKSCKYSKPRNEAEKTVGDGDDAVNCV